MLRELVIKDFVIVDYQHLTFQDGLVAITGETGTGKSLIIDALGLLKGGRAREDMIRQGQKSALVEGLFDLSPSPDLKLWLEKNELTGEIEDEIVLSREILRDGRSRSRINGRSVPAGALKDASSMLIDIYGQREHERFLAVENQLSILDVFLSPEGKKEKNDYIQKYSEWSDLHRELEQLNTGDGTGWNDLKFIAQEFEDLHLTPEKMMEVEEEFRMLANVQSYCEALDHFSLLLEGSERGEGVSALLSRMKKELEKIPGEGKMASLVSVLQTLNTIEVEFQEVAYDVASLRSTLDYSPEKIDMLEKSVAEIERLKRKYRCRTTEELIEHQHLVEERLDEIEKKIERKKSLEKQIEEGKRELLEIGKRISEHRQNAARAMESRLRDELAELSFARVEFEVRFSPFSEENPRFHPDGIDEIEFWISLNPGQPPGPVMEVASGGELSRIVLGMKSLSLEMKNLPVMIFDEIDQGVGGKTAFWIGEKLRTIASGRQIICVTHLPQIACFASQHLKVEKYSNDTNTWAEVLVLDEKDDRLQELAHMMGGEDSTVPALQFAEILMNRAGW
jgi:DNA repair protein RecN (Recombination protein N)